MSPYTIFQACAVDAFPQALYIWDDNVFCTGSCPRGSSCLAVVAVAGSRVYNFTRLIKESIFIRVNNATLNRNIGKFQLSYIWNRVLFSTSCIKVAIPQGNVQHSP